MYINDGVCSNPNRDLVIVNNSNTGAAVIEKNDLSGGKNAIVIPHAGGSGAGALLVRFNQISGNSEHALISEADPSNSARLDLVANNLDGNSASPAVDCATGTNAPAPNHTANHNYWSGGDSPSSNDSHCQIVYSKRLGMPIQHQVNAPGVNGAEVNVTPEKTGAFGEQVAFARTGGSGNFPLYIIDYGYSASFGPPFSYASGESPSPCSDYWDVFLPDGVNPDSTLELYFRYDKTTNCKALISSTQYCNQTATPEKYPLYWLDPSVNSVTSFWDTVGDRPSNQTSSDGQKVSCTDNAEIHVSIDNSGRPNLKDDLYFTPFMVGIPVIKSFQPLASNQTITVGWTTNNEPDIVGFYVLRGSDANHLTQITGMIKSLGDTFYGHNYPRQVVETGLPNGTPYSYRLQVVRTDGASFYSDVISLAANTPTRTSIPTSTPTRTRTPVLPTYTPRFTTVPPRTATRRATASPTARTVTPQPTQLTLPTLTPTLDLSTPGNQLTATARVQTAAAQIKTGAARPTSLGTSYPVGTGEPGIGTPGAGTPGAGTPSAGTPVAALELTSTPSPTPDLFAATTVAATAQTSSSSSPWVSLMLGLLAGLAAVGGLGGFWYWRMRN